MARRKDSAQAKADATASGGRDCRTAPADPRSRYRIFPEKCPHGFRALTRVEETDPKTGETVSRLEDWGFVSKDGHFLPERRYWESPEEERRRLIFPLEWDLHELESVRAIQKPKGRKQMLESDPEPSGESLLYGDVWLLDKAAEASGLREDLVNAFEGDDALAEHLLATAMFLAAGHGPLRQMEHWQRVRAMRIPAPQTLGGFEETSSFCSGDAIEEFYRLRAARLAGKACIAVESTVRAELTRTDGLSLAVGMEGPCERIPKVDVYALEDGMPVFSHAFLHSELFGADLAESMLAAVAKAGLKDTPLVTTLGFEDLRLLARLVRQDAPLVMPTSLHQPHVAATLKRFGSPSALQKALKIEASDRFRTLFSLRQFAIDENGKVIDEKIDNKCTLNLNLYYDESINFLLKCGYFKLCCYNESRLKTIINEKIHVEYDDLIEYDDFYFDIEYNEKSKLVENYTKDYDAINHERDLSGVYAVSSTPAVKYDATKILEIVNLAYEQSKSCEAMFARCYEDVDNLSLDDLFKEVFHLVVFLAQSLEAFLERVRREKLSKRYRSVADMLGEMQDIRWIEHVEGKPAVSILTDRQRAVCWAFDFECPDLNPPAPRHSW